MPEITFTPNDAELLVGALSLFGLPYVVSILKRVTMPEYVKFLIAAACSLVLAALTLYAGGDLNHPMTLTALVFMFIGAAHAQYVLYFKPLGLDRFFNPEPAPVAEPQESPSEPA